MGKAPHWRFSWRGANGWYCAAGARCLNARRRRLTTCPGIDAKCFGAVPGPLVLAGIIRRDGFAVTARPTAHARPVSRWALRDREAAERWLRDHSEPPDDDDAPTVQFPLSPLPNEPTAAVAAVAGGGESPQR